MASVLAFSGLALMPSAGSATEVAPAPLLAYDDAALTPALYDDGSAATDAAAAMKPALFTTPSPALMQDAEADEAEEEATEVDPASLECMAKVVMHESRGQPRAGQVAVAQTLVHRLKSGRFGGSICEVANQPGQYFDTASYRPRRDSADWKMAVDISRDVLSGEAETVAPGAMFFRATYKPANSFFRSRRSVTTIGGHVFYR